MNKTKENLYKANDELIVLREKVAVMENEHTKIRALANHWEERHNLENAKLEGYREALEIIFHKRKNIYD